MKESKGVYVTKRDIRDLQHKVDIYYNNNTVNSIEVNKLTNDVGIQYNSKRDNIFYAHRKFSNVRRCYDHDLRYFNPIPKLIYKYSQSKSFTDIGVGSVKALQKKKVKRIYLPETDDRGVGSSDWTTFISRIQSLQNKNKLKQYRTRQSHYDTKRTSSKCVGGAVEYRTQCLVSAKVSPIVHTQSGSTSPKDPGFRKTPENIKDSKDIEIGSKIIEKHFVTTDTQFEEPEPGEVSTEKVELIASEPNMQEYRVILENRIRSSEIVEEKVASVEVLQSAEKPPAIPKIEVLLPKKISESTEPLKASFSSDSLIQHVHNLEQPSEYSKQRDPMENKMEREYRKMFASVSRDDKKETVVEKQLPEKSTSLFRRRFTAIRKTLGKRDSKSGMGANQASVPSVKDASITSDPPSLEEKSFSSITYSKNRRPRKTSYKKSRSTKKPSKNWPKPNAIDSEYGQGVKGMFKLWGKKFNLEDTSNEKQEELEQQSFDDKPEEKEEEPKEIEPKEKDEKKYNTETSLEAVSDERNLEKEKKEGKKFFFFKKKVSKDKTKNQNQSYKSKKGVTTGRCEVKDGLSIRMGARTTPAANKKAPNAPKVAPKGTVAPVNNYDLVRAAWLMRYLSTPIESKNSVKVRWNNKTYATSSSTIFELMGSVYKNTGIVLKSKSEIATDASSTWSSYHPNVNFVQQIEAWMIPRTIVDQKPPVIFHTRPIADKKVSKSKSENDNKNTEVKKPGQNWIIDKSKAFAHKIEVVLHTKNFVKLQKPESSADYLRITIPKDFFSNSSSDEPQLERSSDEEVYNIIEYESGYSGAQLRKKTKALAPNITDLGVGSEKIQVTVSLRSGICEETKILETVINGPANHRDVVLQGSNVYIPKTCDVIGVGIITGRNVREIKKPLVVEYLSEDESEHSLPKQCSRNNEFARTYLQDYYNHWQPLGVDMFSWCVSDSHMQCCSEHNNSRPSFNNGDTTKSCPNIIEEFLTMVSSYSSGGDQKPSMSCNNKMKRYRSKKEVKVGTIDNGMTQCRVLPKDSVAVYKKRKIYAMERSKWVDDLWEPCFIPSNANTGIQRKVVNQMKRVELKEPEKDTDYTQKKADVIKTATISPDITITITDRCRIKTSSSSFAETCGTNKKNDEVVPSDVISSYGESHKHSSPSHHSLPPTIEGEYQQQPLPQPCRSKTAQRDELSRTSFKNCLPSDKICYNQNPTSPPKSPSVSPPIACPRSPLKHQASALRKPEIMPPRSSLYIVRPESPYYKPQSDEYSKGNSHEASLCQSHVTPSSSPKNQVVKSILNVCPLLGSPAHSSKSLPRSCDSSSVRLRRSPSATPPLVVIEASPSIQYSCTATPQQCKHQCTKTQTPSECPQSGTPSPQECPPNSHIKCPTGVKLSNTDCTQLPNNRNNRYSPRSKARQSNSPLICSPKTSPKSPPCPPKLLPRPPKSPPCPPRSPPSAPRPPKSPPGSCIATPKRPKSPPCQTECSCSPKPPPKLPKSPPCPPKSPPKRYKSPPCPPKSPPKSSPKSPPKSSPKSPPNQPDLCPCIAPAPPSPCKTPPKSPPSPNKTSPKQQKPPAKTPPCPPKPPPPKCPQGFKISNTDCIRYPKPQTYGTSSKPQTYGTSSDSSSDKPPCCNDSPCCSKNASHKMKTDTNPVKKSSSPCCAPCSVQKSSNISLCRMESDNVKISIVPIKSISQIFISRDVTSNTTVKSLLMCSDDCTEVIKTCESAPQQCPVCMSEKILKKPKSAPNFSNRLTGIFLKKYPRDIYETSECQKAQPNVTKTKKGYIIVDGSGKTLVERKDHTKCMQTPYNAIYNESELTRNITPITINEMASVTREKEVTEQKSNDSLVNMIEINFKLRVIQGDKTMEINIANEDAKGTTDDTIDAPQKPNRKKCDIINNNAEQVYILKNEDALEEVNPKNDLNIRILIKNYKLKTDTSKEIKAVDKFSQNISTKFNTVSTGYDCIGEPPDTCFSIHRATIDLTTSTSEKITQSQQRLRMDKSKSKFQKYQDKLCEKLSNTLREIRSKTENKGSVKDDHSKISMISDIGPNNLILVPTGSEYTKSVSSSKRKSDLSSMRSVDFKPLSSKNFEYTSSKLLHRSNRCIPHRWSKSDEGYTTTDKSFDKTESINFKESRKSKMTDIFQSKPRLSFTDTDERDLSLGNKTSEDLLLCKTSDERTDAFGKSSEDRTDRTDGTSELIIQKVPTEEMDYIDLGKSRREEKKAILKQVFENDNYFKKRKTKTRIQKLKDMLKALLTTSEDTDSEAEHTLYGKMLIDSQNPGWEEASATKLNSDSLNNSKSKGGRGERKSNIDSSRSNGSEYSVDDDKPKNKTCLCSTFAEKLKLGNVAGGGCCCRKLPEQVNEQISCNFVNELTLQDYSYFLPSVEDVYCQTNKSSMNCAKIVSISSKKTSFITPRSQKISFIKETNNVEIKSSGFEKVKYHEKSPVHEPVIGKKIKLNQRQSESKEMRSRESNFNVEGSEENSVLDDEARTPDIRETDKKRHHTKVKNRADVLQMYETKKAVLEIYAEKTVTDDEEHLVAKLPKFVRGTESQLYECYEQLDRDKYGTVYKRNFVMCTGP